MTTLRPIPDTTHGIVPGYAYVKGDPRNSAANPATPSNPLDDCDEHTGRLLLAIETMCTELRAGRANEALITGVMALSEHRMRLVDHSAPLHIASLWEDEQETGEP